MNDLYSIFEVNDYRDWQFSPLINISRIDVIKFLIDYDQIGDDKVEFEYSVNNGTYKIYLKKTLDDDTSAFYGKIYQHIDNQLKQVLIDENLIKECIDFKREYLKQF